MTRVDEKAEARSPYCFYPSSANGRTEKVLNDSEESVISSLDIRRLTLFRVLLVDLYIYFCDDGGTKKKKAEGRVSGRYHLIRGGVTDLWAFDVFAFDHSSSDG